MHTLANALDDRAATHPDHASIRLDDVARQLRGARPGHRATAGFERQPQTRPKPCKVLGGSNTVGRVAEWEIPRFVGRARNGESPCPS